jgi:hypothetical protein
MCSHILQNLAFESSEIAVSIRSSYFIENKLVSGTMIEDISCFNSVHESNMWIYVYKTPPNNKASQFLPKNTCRDPVDKMMLPDSCDVDTAVPE